MKPENFASEMNEFLQPIEKTFAQKVTESLAEENDYYRRHQDEPDTFTCCDSDDGCIHYSECCGAPVLPCSDFCSDCKEHTAHENF